jgi:hypothetical protein
MMTSFEWKEEDLQKKEKDEEKVEMMISEERGNGFVLEEEVSHRLREWQV